MSKYNWDVDTLLSSYEIDNLKEDIISKKEVLLTYKGSVVKNIDFVLTLDFEISQVIEKIYSYYSHIADIDLANSESQANLLSFKNFYYQIVEELSFITPEILSEDILVLEKLRDNNQKYFKVIDELIKQKQYVLSESEEALISKASQALSSSYSIYSILTNTEIKFENIYDENNNELELNEANYSIYIRSYDKTLRKNAFIGLLNGYARYKNTISSIYISYLQAQKFKVDSRGYTSPRQRALFNNQIDEVIYDNLISAVSSNIDANHEYLNMRKEILDVNELNLYDGYVPLVSGITKVFDYDAAIKMVIDSLSVLGDEYVKQAKFIMNSNTIDVYPKEGKRSGAYSGGSYDSKPYILLNYTKTLDDVFTLTHELGHSMHSLKTNENQEYQNSHYKIFVAEIASTVNELLLFNHLYENEQDIDVKLNLINQNLDQYRLTVFRQAMFAEFEYESSKLFYNNEAISEEILSNLYLKLNKKYFGDNVIINEEIKYEWLRIPHFYYDFYVYQYATSFCVAQKIVYEIKNGNDQMVKKYLNFLSSGDSVEPIELIKLMGIDIKDVNTLDDALKNYKVMIKEFRQLMKEKNVK